MYRKSLLILGLCTINVFVNADDIATNFMLMNNYNVRQSQDIWARMRQGFQLNHTENAQVKYYEQFYSRSPTHFNKIVKNASPYLYYVLTQTERYGLPSELALIPIVESDYDPFTINGSKSYDGMWQFTPSTGASFSLNENNYINERKNIIKSTNAALNYLIYLHEMFKQWDVAIGSYNWGPGNMGKAIVASNQKIGSITYTDLPLRKITADYVPKVIALSNIIANPNKFGIKLDNAINQPYFAIIHPTNNDTLHNITDKSNTDYQTFKILNPQFKDIAYTPQQQTQILVPFKNQTVYLASLNQPKQDIEPVIVATQTTTNIINTSTSNAPIVPNNMQSSSDIIDSNDAINQIGYADNNTQNIKTTITQNAPNTQADDIDDTDNNYIKVVNISSTSTQTEVASDKPILIVPRMASNHSANTQLNILVADLGNKTETTTNTRTHLTKVQHSQIATNRTIKYKVNRGDTLYSIAKKFNVDISDIRRINKIRGNSVQYKQVLKIVTNTVI